MSDRIATVQELVAARESRGLSPADVMRQLKLAPRQLDALEAGDWSVLPGQAFVRGVLRGYGRLLEVDVEPLVEAMSASVRAADLRPAASLDEPLPTRSMLGFGAGGSGSRLTWGLLLMLAVLAVALFFGGARSGSIASWLDAGTSSTTQAVPEQGPGEMPVPASAPATPSDSGTVTESLPLAPLAPAADSAAASAQPAAGAGSAPASPVVQPAVAPVDPSAPAAATAAAGTPGDTPLAAVASTAGPQSAAPALRLRFSQAAWVEARRDGQVLLSGVQPAGSERTLPIEGRTALVVGNAANVAAEFDGKAFDLSAHVRGSVARFSLP